MNVDNRTLFIADNLDIMRGMDSETIDLIYLDPPFNSKKQYKAPIGSPAEGATFKDIWTDEDVRDGWHSEIAEDYPQIHQIILAAEHTYDHSMMIYLMAMGIRLIEMKRILKPTGSIYLHCDPTASHYLKAVMDDIFGKNNFRNEITWKRATSTQKGSQHRSMRWGNNADILLFYAVSRSASLYPEKELTESEILEKFKYIDENGQRYYDDSAHIWSSPNMGPRPNLCYEWRGFVNPHPSGWRLSKERLQEEYQKGNIVIRPDGKLERRKYLKDYKGASYGNIWDDIPPSAGEERTGYPTQKPLALLNRIIKASSNEGDIVLDPFCGCATACVAAERLGRQWIGIDISPSAETITKLRLTEEAETKAGRGTGVLKENQLPLPFDPMTDIHILTQPPLRTDVDENEPQQQRLPNYRVHKNDLYGKQEGYCNGCERHFEIRNLTVDHEHPQSKGGTDHPDNLQLLCQACNSTKGKGTQEELISRLKEQGVLK